MLGLLVGGFFGALFVWGVVSDIKDGTMGTDANKSRYDDDAGGDVY